MADHSAPETSSAESAKKGPGLLTLVKAIAFVSVIVIIEVAAGAMMFPSAEETRAVGEQLVQGGEEATEGEHGGEGAKGDAHGHGEGVHTKEMELGAYHIVSFNPKTGSSLSVDFELAGAVLAEEEAEFNELFTVNEKRVNEQVTIAVRGLEVGDLTDPGLGLMKRIILEKTNRALGKPLIREVVVPQFSFLER